MRIFLFFLVLVLPVFTSQAADDQPRTLIILDASGSMWGLMDGEHKIDIAKQVVSDLVQEIPEDTELGLVAYGHRHKGDCDDIELLIPPGTLDRQSFIEAVNKILPKGKTPIADSLQFAADSLKLEENPATVILISDGLETCGKDPCAVAKSLEAAGIDFTAHVIGFDLNVDEAAQLECIAKITGGEFLPAQDADSLRFALETAVAQSAAPVAEATSSPTPPPPATLLAADSVPAGSLFPVTWEGPNDQGDYITIVPADAAEEAYDRFAYTKQGNPLELRAMIEPQQAELRYISRTGGVIGRRPIEVTPIEVSLQAPESVVAGAPVKVVWTGPDYQGDYLTIVAADAEPGVYNQYAYTRAGSPASIKAPIEPGNAEVRYMSGQSRKVLATTPIIIEPAEATLSASEEAVAGAQVKIEWTGPDNQGDYITIVPADADAGTYQNYAYTQTGSPLTVKAPIETGPFEIRYLTGQGDKTLAARPIAIQEAAVKLEAPDSGIAGSEIPVEWVGPGNEGDYVTIVPADAPEGQYKHYAYAKNDPVLRVKAPIEPGPHEVRYLSGQGDRTLAAVPISIQAAEVTLQADEEVVAGSPVSIEWTGPANQGDYITIVPAELEEGNYRKYAYTKDSSPVQVIAPIEPGACEIRYVTGSGGKTLASRPIKTLPPEISFDAPESAEAGSVVTVGWMGPGNPRDYITIVPKEMPEGKYAKFAYAQENGQVKIQAPPETGPAEVRYVSGQSGTTLYREDIVITAPTAEE